MKKTVICACCAVLGAVAAFAEPSWAVVNTTGANGDESGNTAYYTAYLCTVVAAETYFGGKSSYDDITAYLSASAANYNSGVAAISEADAKMSAYGYDEGEYSFSLYQKPETWIGSDYVALVTYANDGDTYFRVFEGSVANDRLVLDPGAGKGSAGAWTAAAVPEPTSGLLLLLGVAGLALRRRRAV